MSTSAELTHLFRQLKAPAAARMLPKLADRARSEEWSYERFAEALSPTDAIAPAAARSARPYGPSLQLTAAEPHSRGQFSTGATGSILNRS